MQCSRCGFYNEAGFEWCVQCGTALAPIPYAQRNSLPRAGMAEIVEMVDTGPMDAVWREDAGNQRSATPGEGPPSWLANALRTQEPARQGTGGAPDWLWPTQEPSAPQDGAMGNYWGSPSDQAVHTSPPNVADSFPEMGYEGYRRYEDYNRLAERALVPLGLQFPAQALSSPAQGLVPGMTLKLGRYRLLQPFHLAANQQPQGSEPPLMIALDAEIAGGRVLVQEVLLHARPEESEQMRRLLAHRLQDLAQIAAIPKVIDHFEERRHHFLVFELPSGESLLDRIERTHGPLDETVAIQHALQVLDTLAVFERQQPPVIHGNISSANILLRPGGTIVLVGFSPALLLNPGGRVEHGPAGGVPGYAPPEQVRGQATPRADLFAVCAVLQHAVTGITPTPRSSVMHPPTRHLNPDASLELEEVLGRGLRPSSTQRFQTVGELRAALSSVVGGRRTHVPDELRDDEPHHSLAPVRDARGHLILPRQHALQNPLTLIGAVLLMVLIAGAGMLYAVAPRPGGSGAQPTPNPIVGAYLSRGIGLSGGEFIFDKDQSVRANIAEKQAGARALAAGDINGALAAYRAATLKDQADAEAAIYMTNLAILQAQSPYVTLIAAVAFGYDNAAARAELQGVFLAQQYVNQHNLLPSGVQVRVLVLNSGSEVAEAKDASDFLLDQIHAGNAQHLVGIIGWPATEQTRLALSELKPSGLAVLSPTASADGLGGYGANFFPMAPSDSRQGRELLESAVDDLGARHLLVLRDNQNTQSKNTATAFLTLARTQHYVDEGVTASEASYTSGTKSDFRALAGRASAEGDDLVFLACGAGCDGDAALLAQAVADQQFWPTGTPAKILVDSHGFTPALVGLGDSPVAASTRAKPTALSNVYVTLLAARDEWSLLNIDTAIHPTFPNDYDVQFGPSAEPNGLDGPNPLSILSFDAARLLLKAGGQTLHADHGIVRDPDQVLQTQVRNRLLYIDDKHPYMGVGGALAFTITGAQHDKALVIARLVLVPGTGAAADKPVAQPQPMYVVGGKKLFCANTGCKPS